MCPPVLLFGDETSFGLANALLDAVRADCYFVAEVDDPFVANGVLTALGIEGAKLFARRADEGHPREAEHFIAGAPLWALGQRGLD